MRLPPRASMGGHRACRLAGREPEAFAAASLLGVADSGKGAALAKSSVRVSSRDRSLVAHSITSSSL
jgi:hypothetical protein